MKVITTHLIPLILLLFALFVNKVNACSMYKITKDGKTVVGCNHDTWLYTPKIWFEQAKKTNEFGACFTGARQVGVNRTAPQSGMNEAGLAFSRLQAYYPEQKNPFSNSLKIANEVDYLTSILHQCATVKEVKKYVEAYDHSEFINDVFIYIDGSGNYLIVEPYTFIEGNDSNYVLSNFCPSITNTAQARKLVRYRNGVDFLKAKKVESTLAYFTALSDTMHVCRNRNGDGTLLTSVWDTKNKLVNLYFYHTYDSSVQFNLAKELAKGDHVIEVPTLFPSNAEFDWLKTYKTPFNTPYLRLALVLMGGLLAFVILLLVLAVTKVKSTEISIKNSFLLLTVNLLLIGYLIVLVTNEYVYYFDAPYKHYSSKMISAFSYTPFLLLVLIIPISLFSFKRFTSSNTKGWIKAALLANNLIYLLLILSFGYWGLFSFWN